MASMYWHICDSCAGLCRKLSILEGSAKDGGGSDSGSPVRSYLEHEYRPTLDDQASLLPELKHSA